ncbi:MAG: lipopolysaccharide biosynthesis protein [Prevotellaceae bacterium]|nr:lipopolysaccharide biosynthesis protein [Prevotellaceae bacterium]
MSNQSSDNNKRIAKNTLLLYFRMLFMMVVSLYTSRVVLDKLGVSDFGIYNVVGGIVTMLGFLNGSMSNAVQRFLSFELGRDNKEGVSRIFNVSLQAHGGIAVFVFVVMKIAGVWYLNTYMNIPPDRLEAANWALQCSLITTLFSIVQVPYNAIIIAKEQMGIYAYISILEVALKLLIVYLLVIVNFDKLKMYSVLIMIVSIGIMMIYRLYCIRKYEEARFRLTKDWNMLKQLLSFASWNMLGEMAWVLTGQGVNIILNFFFGPVVNAAKGLAEQVNGAVNRFVLSFQMAANPQLIKDYAAGQYQEMKTLLYRSIRFSYFLLFVLSLPLILKMDYILHLWLKEVPKYAVGFCQLVLVGTMIANLSNQMTQIARAHGKIRNFELIVAFFLLLNFPLSYIVLKLGASPLATMEVYCGVQTALLFVRLKLTGKRIQMTCWDYVKNVLIRVALVTLASLIVPISICWIIGNTFMDFIIVCVSALLSVCLCTYLLGMNKNERVIVSTALLKVVRKLI